MKVQDLKDEIERKLGLEFDDDIVFDVFNEALMDLAEVLRLETKSEADLDAQHQTVAWPSDVFELIMVKLDKTGKLDIIHIDDEHSVGCKVFGGQLHFQKSLKPPDKATIWYYRYPEIVEDVNNEPDIPLRFRHALKYYFIAAYQQEDEELKLEEDYWNKYYRVKAEIDRHTRKQKGLHRRRLVKARPFI